MDRALKVIVDHKTWPAGTPAPSTFPLVPQLHDVNIPALLLIVGYITTPAHAYGISLSSYWAWVRYLHAISNDADFRITTSFADLDAHQKTILSDDFGMGAPLLWLMSALPFDLVCDGRYFIERHAATFGAVTTAAGKRGPQKSADFVFRDLRGIWHVLECKGTQSGARYRTRQMASALDQKRTIYFPSQPASQNLACGLSIGIEAQSSSDLLVMDPTPAEGDVLRVEDLAVAQDAATRAMAARALRLAGYEATANVVAAPSGRDPRSRYDPNASLKSELAREDTVRRKTRSAEDELRDRDRRERFTRNGVHFRGRSVTLDLAAPVLVGGVATRTAEVQQGINSDVLEEIAGRFVVPELIQDAHATLSKTLGSVTIEVDSRFASLKVGELFRAELKLT